MVEPEDDFKCLIENERRLQMCGYYYGNLSWKDASDLLAKCKDGTFLVRDAMQSNYLYILTVRSQKRSFNYRIEYLDASFRMESSRDISRSMPRFDCVPHLIEFYVRLANIKNNKVVYIGIDKDPVPFKMYQPLYRQVRSLTHMSWVTIVRQVKTSTIPLVTQNPVFALKKILEKNFRCKTISDIIKDYLSRYPYSQ